MFAVVVPALSPATFIFYFLTVLSRALWRDSVWNIREGNTVTDILGFSFFFRVTFENVVFEYWEWGVIFVFRARVWTSSGVILTYQKFASYFVKKSVPHSTGSWGFSAFLLILRLYDELVLFHGSPSNLCACVPVFFTATSIIVYSVAKKSAFLIADFFLYRFSSRSPSIKIYIIKIDSNEWISVFRPTHLFLSFLSTDEWNHSHITSRQVIFFESFSLFSFLFEKFCKPSNRTMNQVFLFTTQQWNPLAVTFVRYKMELVVKTDWKLVRM